METSNHAFGKTLWLSLARLRFRQELTERIVIQHPTHGEAGLTQGIQVLGPRQFPDIGRDTADVERWPHVGDLAERETGGAQVRVVENGSEAEHIARAEGTAFHQRLQLSRQCRQDRSAVPLPEEGEEGHESVEAVEDGSLNLLWPPSAASSG